MKNYVTLIYFEYNNFLSWTWFNEVTYEEPDSHCPRHGSVTTLKSNFNIPSRKVYFIHTSHFIVWLENHHRIHQQDCYHNMIKTISLRGGGTPNSNLINQKQKPVAASVGKGVSNHPGWVGIWDWIHPLSCHWYDTPQPVEQLLFLLIWPHAASVCRQTYIHSCLVITVVHHGGETAPCITRDRSGQRHRWKWLCRTTQEHLLLDTVIPPVCQQRCLCCRWLVHFPEYWG